MSFGNSRQHKNKNCGEKISTDTNAISASIEIEPNPFILYFIQVLTMHFDRSTREKGIACKNG